MSPTEAPADTRARAYHRRQLALSLAELALSASYLIVLVETRAAVHLAERLATGAPLAEIDWPTVYGSGRRGYSDYPTLRYAMA